MDIIKFLNGIITPTIYMVAIAEFALMLVSAFIMFKFRTRIWKLNRKGIKRSKDAKKQGKGKVQKTYILETNHDWDEFDQFLEDYQKKGCWYSAFSMIIQLFTLLGILGTVVGLYDAMPSIAEASAAGQSNMFSGIGFALETTILGIAFTVIYKVADIIIVSTLINYIEDGINRYEKIYKVDSEEAEKSVVVTNESN